MNPRCTIYVELLDEGVQVWRPVLAEHLSGNIYRILDQPYDRTVEEWQFGPGEHVMCEERETSEGSSRVAVRRA